MKRPGSCHACVVYFMALLTASYSATANAQDSAPDALAPYLRQPWHDVEVIVFERPGVGDIHAGENLMLAAPRHLPARFLSLAEEGWLNPVLPLDDDTRRSVETFTLGGASDQAKNSRTDATTPNPRTTAAKSASAAAPTDVSTVAEPPPPPSTEELFRSALTAWEDDVEASSFTARAAEDRALSTIAARLIAQGGAQILWHERWSQALAKPAQSIPILVNAGPLLIDRFHLEGTLDIARTDTIQVKARFWLNGPHVGREPILLAAGAAAHNAAADIIPLVMNRYLAIDEQRTLAPGELTYLDHPRFGVLIRVRPITPPESVLAAFEAFRTGGNNVRD